MNKVSATPAVDTADEEAAAKEADWRITHLPRMMSISDASVVMGLTRYEVLEMIGAGALPAVHVGPWSKVKAADPIWLHPADVRAEISRREHIAKWASVKGDDQLCMQQFIQFGKEQAREITDLMIDATGAGCPCTWGDPCMFKPRKGSPRKLANAALVDEVKA